MRTEGCALFFSLKRMQTVLLGVSNLIELLEKRFNILGYPKTIEKTTLHEVRYANKNHCVKSEV